MADKQRERRAKTHIDAFLQHTSIGQRRDYLARGRRFGTLDGGQLRESWIIAVRNWLAIRTDCPPQPCPLPSTHAA